jgi:hypothetical protein
MSAILDQTQHHHQNSEGQVNVCTPPQVRGTEEGELETHFSFFFRKEEELELQ